MRGQPYRVEVESIHWPTLLPSLRLFDAFRLAIHPSKLLLGFLLAALLYLGGLAYDVAAGRTVHRGDFEQYASLPTERYERWLRVMDEHAQRQLDRGETPDRVGVFDAALTAELAAFRAGLAAALSLDFGVRAVLAGRGLDSGGVLGALGTMFVRIPAWLAEVRPVFFWLYLIYGYALTALFGGAIARLAALHACRDRRVSPMVGARFAARWYLWFAIAPLLPLAVAGVIALVLAVAGLVFFNLPVLDIVGGLLFGPMLLGGFIIALILLGLAVGSHVLYPAIAVEGTDAFDAISRAYNYALGRPLRFLVYVAAALLYFAVAFLFVSLILYAAIWSTQATVGAWAVREVSEGVGRFEAANPGVVVHGPTTPPRWTALDGTGVVAAWLVSLWVKLLLLLLPAFAISFYFSASTWIYLLLRRSGDGVEFEDVYLDGARPEPSPVDEEDVAELDESPSPAPPKTSTPGDDTHA